MSWLSAFVHAFWMVMIVLVILALRFHGKCLSTLTEEIRTARAEYKREKEALAEEEDPDDAQERAANWWKNQDQ